MARDDAQRREVRSQLRSSPRRAGARAHFRAMGVDPERLDGPIVGIASTWTRTMPCNLGLRRLASRGGAAVEGAGGGALEFNTLAGSRKQKQGPPGVRGPPVPRRVV